MNATAEALTGDTGAMSAADLSNRTDLGATVGDVTAKNPRMVCRAVDVYYGDKQAIKSVNLDIGHNEVISMIGPSGCGKSTFLRCLNRMNDTIPAARVTGSIKLDGREILDKGIDVVPLRAQVGMVFQKPNPFPKSIYENVAYGPRIHGITNSKAELDALVETSLTKAGLWKEVKDRLAEPGTGLSGGQQQRLCLARTLAMQPEVILLDEPTSGLDPISTAKIEETLFQLKSSYSIILVSNNTKQIARTTDRVAFLLMSRLVEYGVTPEVFMVPKNKQTDDYISGRFG